MSPRRGAAARDAPLSGQRPTGRARPLLRLLLLAGFGLVSATAGATVHLYGKDRERPVDPGRMQVVLAGTPGCSGPECPRPAGAGPRCRGAVARRAEVVAFDTELLDFASRAGSSEAELLYGLVNDARALECLASRKPHGAGGRGRMAG